MTIPLLAKVLKQDTKYIYCCPQGQTFSSRAQAACIIFLSLALQPQTNQQIVHQYLHKLPSGFNFFLQAAKYFFYLLTDIKSGLICTRVK